MFFLFVTGNLWIKNLQIVFFFFWLCLKICEPKTLENKKKILWKTLQEIFWLLHLSEISNLDSRFCFFHLSEFLNQVLWKNKILEKPCTAAGVCSFSLQLEVFSLAVLFGIVAHSNHTHTHIHTERELGFCLHIFSLIFCVQYMQFVDFDYNSTKSWLWLSIASLLRTSIITFLLQLNCFLFRGLILFALFFFFCRKLWRLSLSFCHSSSCSTCYLSIQEFWVLNMVQHTTTTME